MFDFTASALWQLLKYVDCDILASVCCLLAYVALHFADRISLPPFIKTNQQQAEEVLVTVLQEPADVNGLVFRLGRYYHTERYSFSTRINWLSTEC